MTPTLFLGIDGGGTRCRARIESADGAIVGSGLAGPATMRFGIAAATDAIMAATRLCLADAGLAEDALANTYAGIGLAGTGQTGARDALEAWRHPFAGAWFEGDGYLGYLGAFGGGPGGVVIAGTGSIGITYHGHTIRIGGYGFPVSDEGSGADLGLNALRHALRTLDGRADPSAFSTAVLGTFSGDPSRVITWMESATATDYAALAPIVIQHAASGDPAAIRLMQQAGANIADLIEALLKQGAPQVALIGGLASFLTPFIPPLTAARLVPPQADALSGGILLARQKSGL